jgi:hypothetical protein
MTTDTALIEKREELKRRLAAGEYKTLVDVFLAWTYHVIQKTTRRSKPLPIWLIMIIVSLGVTLIAFAIIYISGDIAFFLVLNRTSGGLGILTIFSESVIAIAIVIAMNQYIRKIFVLWRDETLDATESVASLDDFEDWLKKTCNWRLHLLVTIIAVIILNPIGTSLIKTQLGISVGYGSILSLYIFSMFLYALLYLFLMVILLSVRLRRYDLKLFAADPSSSELISHLSGELVSVIYIVTAYMISGLITIGLVFGVVDLHVVIAQVLLGWLPIIALFTLIQTSLSNIIRRAKWKTLNEIQEKVEKLQAVENFEDKETMEAINRLMDYHDRVKATRNSALDLNSTLHFINSLLLPLLAFLLGNIDKLIALLPQRP